MLQHYIESIKMFGTTNGYNTETTERLHIDYVKDAWRGSNKKNALEQMGRWLIRREAIHDFGYYVKWQTGDLDMAPQTPRGRRRVCESKLGMTVAKAPSARNVSIQVLEDKYGAQGFSKALQTFVSQYREQNARYTRRRRDEDVRVYVSHVDVWHTLKFNLVDIQLGTRITHDIIHVAPPTVNQRTKKAGRFDTVFINDTGAEAVGIEGV